MKLTLGPTDQFEPISEGRGQIWVGQTSGGIEIVAVIAIVGCKPEDREALALESAGGGTSLQFVKPEKTQLPDMVHAVPKPIAETV